ncbi:MAG: hypothetical protein GY821_10475, partial [Gammaproteobacteria bacterium]|nr:hypothetical protein [Gammaproteobacteria bacterium]
MKEDSEQAQPSHQMTLRQTSNLNLDGIASVLCVEAPQSVNIIGKWRDRTKLAWKSPCESEEPVNSCVLFSVRCDYFGMADKDRKHSRERQRTEENERRKKEDEKRAKEDERRRKEDERRLAEDKEHREEKEKQRAKKFAEEFTQESEQGASSRRKVARHKQSYSPPKAKKGTLPTRAKSHLHQRGVGQQGL